MPPHEPHPVYQQLKEGILARLEAREFRPDYDSVPDKFKASVQKAIDDQQSIGWEATIKGYLSVEWRYMASLGIYDTDTPHEGRGMQGIRSMLLTFQKLIQALWTSRNQVLHGSNDLELQNIRESELAEIRAYYNNPEMLLSGDRHYCEQTLQSIVTRAPTTRRRRWLRYMRLARLRFQREGSC